MYSALEDVAENVFSSISQPLKRSYSRSESSSRTVLNDLTSTYKEITGLQTLFLGDNGVRSILGQELLQTLLQQTSIEVEPLSPQASLILHSLNRSAAQFDQLRTIAETSGLQRVS
ncbi:unnamed protein product [Mucor fragilis]